MNTPSAHHYDVAKRLRTYYIPGYKEGTVVQDYCVVEFLAKEFPESEVIPSDQSPNAECPRDGKSDMPESSNPSDEASDTEFNLALEKRIIELQSQLTTLKEERAQAEITDSNLVNDLIRERDAANEDAERLAVLLGLAVLLAASKDMLWEDGFVPELVGAALAAHNERKNKR